MISWQFNPYSIPLFIAVAVAVGLMFYVWPHRSRQGALAFIILVFMAGEWSLTYAFEMLAINLPEKMIWAKMQYFGISFLPVAWLVFAVEMTWRPPARIVRLFLPVLLVPVVTIILMWTTEWHGWMYRSIELQTWGRYKILHQAYGPWFWVNLGFSYLVLFASTVRLVYSFNWRLKQYRLQALILLAGVLLPWSGNLGYLSSLVPIPNYDWTPVLFSVSGLLLFFALLRFNLLDLIPLARTAVIQSMKEGVIVLDRRNRILEVNKAAAELLDMQEPFPTGRPVHQILPQLADLLQDAKNVPRGVELVYRARNRERILELDFSSLLSEQFIHRPSGNGQVLGQLLVFRDITRRKQVEAELRSSEESYRGLFNSLMESVYIQDDRGRFLEVNQGAVEMYGYPRQYFLGKTPEAIAAPKRNNLDQIWVQYQQAFAGEPQHFEFWGQRSTGEIFPQEVRLYKGRYFGDDVVIALANDISERKKVEQAIRATNQELERRVFQRTADLQAAYQELESFASSFSQDLRLPLGSLEEDTRCLQDELAGSLDDTGKSYLDHMQQTLGQMNGLVDGLLSLSRYTHADMHFSSVDLSSLAAEILSGLQEQEPDREVKFTVQPHLQVNGDADMLRVMLEQLFNNAWKCTRHRSQTVIDFGARTEGGQKVFYLHDNGIGFDLALSGKLFMPFQRLHKQSEYDGIGIGLATVQRIIRRHGGDIWAYSEPGRGASFFFFLEGMDMVNTLEEQSANPVS